MRITLRTLPIDYESGNTLGAETVIDLDVERLERQLRASVRGQVRFDSGTRGMYAQDASNYRIPPIGVVCPVDEQDVIAAVGVAREFGAPLLARGAGTSIPGQGNNAALMLDFSRHMSGVLDMDADAKTATVLPGTVLDDLQDAASPHGLRFGPNPATHNRCTLGGMIGNNSCGMHSVIAGRTSDNVEALELLTYDGHRMSVGPTSPEAMEILCGDNGRSGEIYRGLKQLATANEPLIRERFPKIPRRVSGYNLDELLPENGFHVARALVGSEGTCAVVLNAKVRLIENPPARALLALGFDDQPSAGDFVPACLAYQPMACEGIDAAFFEKMRRKGMEAKNLHLLPPGRAWLFVEFGGESTEDAATKARGLLAERGMEFGRLLESPADQRHVWDLREAGLGATAHVPGMAENWEGWEDTAVAPARLGEYLRDFRSLLSSFAYEGAFYGHYGDGCVHVRIDFDLRTVEGIAKYRHFVEEGADLVSAYGGSLTGEHGDGQSKGELLTRMYGQELVDAFAKFKGIWDPAWRMNPGKLVAPLRLDEDLKLGAGYQTPNLQTHFKFTQDQGKFGEAALRCVGAGVCRRKSGGLMCPSYMVTGEEKHSTRGRARLLFEMLRGDLVTGGWQSEEVKEALDLCLSCKGCKSECPVQVDMATYKAEFLSHYYEGHRRPLSARLPANIHTWARLGSKAPWLANLLAYALRPIAGIADERRLPRLAGFTFKKWLRRYLPRTGTGARVILWADTFNDHFQPETLQSAYALLEKAGFRVEVPLADLCCGRPFYDAGMMGEAKRALVRIMDVLEEDLDGETPIVVLEPGCASVFRDELLGLFPDDPRALNLSKQTRLLVDFLVERGYQPRKVGGKAIVHLHCHQRSIFGADAYLRLLEDAGVEARIPEEGCCGMAGAFGFEKGARYEVSRALAKRSLVPAIENASEDTIVIADGFSCREQVLQSTGREAHHLAEVLFSPHMDTE